MEQIVFNKDLHLLTWGYRKANWAMKLLKERKII